MTPLRLQRVLLVYPRFTGNQLLNYEHMVRFYPGKRAVMPPLGLLLIAARLGEDFEVRLVDENVRPLTQADVEWSDAVAVSGMHPQRPRITAVLNDANARGKLTIVGGPSANICPEYYPMADVVHVGEIGDATDGLLAFLREARGKPAAQRVFRTESKTPLDDLPLPRLDVIDPNAYFTQPIQFSVGCPFTCEFCDIPMIYGRIARTKSGARVVRELQAIYDAGFVGSIVFVDDNLIAQRKALRAMLPEVIAWQERNGYPYALSGESSINLARDPEALRLLQQARFTHIFFGVESPEPETLAQISKKQNTMDPVLDSLRVMQEYGIEALLGIIFGFDTDTDKTGEAMVRFLRDAEAPIVYFNMLAALPKTPLWDRLKREGRLDDDGTGDVHQSSRLLSGLTTNVRMRLGAGRVRRMLRDTVAQIYEPAEVFRRMLWNAQHVYGQQLQGVPPARTWQERRRLIEISAGTLWNVLRRVGYEAPFRGLFWRYVAALVELRARGQIRSLPEVLLRTGPMAYHLIEWGRRLVEDATREEAAAGPEPARPFVPQVRSGPSRPSATKDAQ